MWIESHQELGRHPKTRKAARLLGISRVTMVGHLHFLWWWSLDFAQDGDLTGYDDDELAEAAEWEGESAQFVAALTEAGFIEPARALHDWHDYAGKLLEQRRANAEKQKRWRERQKTDTSPPHNPPVTVTSPLRNGATVPNRTVPNQTEPNQKITPPTPEPAPTPVAPPDGGGRVRAVPKPSTLNAQQRPRFERWYPTYPNKQHRPEAERAFAKLDPDDETTERLIADTAARQRGRKWSEGFIELPATYLNNRVWEDDIEPVRAVPVRAAHTNGAGFSSDDAFAKNLAMLRRVGRQ